MTSASRASRELRTRLCDLFTLTGPDAPTLCEGWVTSDLAAHLIIRESRPDAALGIIIPPLASITARIQHRYARRDWASLVDRIRRGAPWWSPLRWLDGQANLIEFAVHFEDVRRANPDLAVPEIGADIQELLWRRLGSAGRLFFRRATFPITLRDAKARAHVVRKGEGITITGQPIDLLLEATGRTSSAEITGAPELIHRYEQTNRGI